MEKRSLLSSFHRKWLIVRDSPQRLRLTVTSHYQSLARKSLLETWVTHVSALVSSGQRETDRQGIHRMEFEKSGFIVQGLLKHQSHDWCFTAPATLRISINSLNLYMIFRRVPYTFGALEINIWPKPKSNRKIHKILA